MDKHVKAKVVTEAIRIVTGEGNDEYDGSFEQILPCEEENMDDYYVWNKGQHLFDLMVSLTGIKKDADLKGRLSLFQFSRFYKVPEFNKVGSYFKADLEIAFKNMQRKYDSPAIDIYSFFETVEILAQKIYKEYEESTYGEKIEWFLDAAVEYFEEATALQEAENEK